MKDRKANSGRPLRARPEVGGERRRRQTPHPAARPSAAPSGPDPKSAAYKEISPPSCAPLRRPLLARHPQVAQVNNR